MDRVFDEVLRNLSAFDGDCRRLFHGRGQCFAGFEDLAIDYYPPQLVLVVYRVGYNCTLLAKGLVSLMAERDLPLVAILEQRRYLRHNGWLVLYGQALVGAVARERSLAYSLTLMRHQNIGFFPDMRLGRQRLAELAPNRRVLNLFAYTCSFSVVALASGALSCVNMDLSKSALSIGRLNHRCNGLDTQHVTFLAMDVLKSFGRMKRLGPFDLVVIDPPSCQDGFVAERHYARIVRRLSEFLCDDAFVLACLNAPHLGNAFLESLFDEHQFCLVEQLSRPAEYVECQPERALKIHLYHFRQ